MAVYLGDTTDNSSTPTLVRRWCTQGCGRLGSTPPAVITVWSITLLRDQILIFQWTGRGDDDTRQLYTGGNRRAYCLLMMGLVWTSQRWRGNKIPIFLNIIYWQSPAALLPLIGNRTTTLIIFEHVNTGVQVILRLVEDLGNQVLYYEYLYKPR